jgi:proline dehydrogenase
LRSSALRAKASCANAELTLLDRAIVRLLPAVPKAVVQRLSSRYIAGSELEDAVRVVTELNAASKLATIDVLGEDVTNAAEAEALTECNEGVLTEIDRRGLNANLSVKPTALGLEFGYDLCRANLEHLVAHAASLGNFVRIDMEDSTTTVETLALYRELRAAGYDNLGVVLQASLRRTLDDVSSLADLKPNVRLCKGIYVEPVEIQFRDYEQVRANFVGALDALLEAGAYTAIATHDEWLIDEALKRLDGLRPGEYEFQMLLGVRPQLGDRLIAGGHRLRIYVPFGRHWYEYSLRRLQENPKVAGYVASDTLGRLLPGR